MSLQQVFWDQTRSKNYNQLSWVHNDEHLQRVIRAAELKSHHMVLDLGCGTGVVSNTIVDSVERIFSVDISQEMLKQLNTPNVTKIHWDMRTPLFCDNLFDRIIARMVCHHLTEGLEDVIKLCHNILKPGGILVIAEGVPPTDDPEVVDWYTRMFELKETRLVFKEATLQDLLNQNKFVDVRQELYMMDNFEVNNWIDNSGIQLNLQKQIMDMHRNMSDELKRIYRLRSLGDKIFIRTKNIILSGKKPT